MSSNTASVAEKGYTASAPQSYNIRWFVCALLFAATTINYMDRSVLSFIEPLLHKLPFMGWDLAKRHFHQTVFDNNYGNIIICFQIAYGVGFLFAGRIIDRLGTKIGYAVAIAIWALSSLSHAFVTSVVGFCIARAMLGLGESGNFPAAIKATTEWFPSEERALATGLFNSGSNVCFFLAPLLSPLSPRTGDGAPHSSPPAPWACCWLLVWLALPVQPPAPRLHSDPGEPRRRLRLPRLLRRHHPLLGPAAAGPAPTPSPSARASPTPSGGSTSSTSRSFSIATTGSTCSMPTGRSSPSMWSRPWAPSLAARSPAG